MTSRASDRKHADTATRPWQVRLQQARFTHLLIALFLLLFLSPFIGIFSNELGRMIASLLVIGLFTTVLVAAALAVSDDERLSRVALLLAAACVMLSVLGHLIDLSTFRVFQYVVTICFLAHVVRLIVRALFRLKSVDYDTIAASLCGYLIIGVVFAVVYSLMMEIDANAIGISEPIEASGSFALRFGDGNTATSLYFSFVTLTTLGYGDITPNSMPARMLTTAEAIIGQLYLVVLVARLVGLHISTERAIQQPDPDEKPGEPDLHSGDSG